MVTMKIFIKKSILILICFLLLNHANTANAQITKKGNISELRSTIITNPPNPDFKKEWPMLANYTVPEWFGEAKFGIWVCWNAYTVPAVGDWYARYIYIEGHPFYKYHLKHYGHPSQFGYKDIIQLWKGENFNAQELVDLFVDCGARYIVAMANHHDNFDLWNSKYHEWNSVNFGPRRDIMAEFRDAVKKHEKEGIRWGITSHTERASCWFQTNKGADKTGPYAGVPYDGNDSTYWGLYLPPDPEGDKKPTQPSNAPLYWRQNWLERCKDLIANYNPDFFYVDGGVPFPGVDKGKTGLEMISFLYDQNMKKHDGKNEAVMCIKDWYKKAPHGEWGYYWDGIATLNLERSRLPKIRKEPWQTDTSIGDWTYVKDGKYRSATEIIQELIDIVSKNGNLLLNVSPKEDGTLDSAAYNLLKEIGFWMKVNGESVYGTKPWKTSGDGTQRIVTKGKNTLYLSLMELPTDNKVLIPYVVPEKGKSLGIYSVSILGAENAKVNWNSDENGLHLEIPEDIDFKHALVFRIQANSLENYDEKAVQKLSDRREELKEWWKKQLITDKLHNYLSITGDNQNRFWAIKTDNSLIELKNETEIQLGMKATDVGASESGIVYTDLNGNVYVHTNHFLEWVDFPMGTNAITHTTPDGKIWNKLPGIKAKRCDISQTGTIWVIDQNNNVAYYNDLVWKPLDKKAEDIACGGSWVGCVAVISNGQLERFEGTHWENLGGKDLKTLDISMQEEIIVTLTRGGKIRLNDVMGSVEIDMGPKKYNDISCGLSINGKETIILTEF